MKCLILLFSFLVLTIASFSQAKSCPPDTAFNTQAFLVPRKSLHHFLTRLTQKKYYTYDTLGLTLATINDKNDTVYKSCTVIDTCWHYGRRKPKETKISEDTLHGTIFYTGLSILYVALDLSRRMHKELVFVDRPRLKHTSCSANMSTTDIDFLLTAIYYKLGLWCDVKGDAIFLYAHN